LLVGADHGFAARHDKAGDAHEIGEAGISGLGDDDQGHARLLLRFPPGPVFPPVISRRQSDKERGAQRALEVFGKRHRRLDPVKRKTRRPWLARVRKKITLTSTEQASRDGAGRFLAVELHKVTRELTCKSV